MKTENNTMEENQSGFIRKQLPWGMDCYLMQMPEFSEKMAAIVVKAGSNFLACDRGEGERPLEFPQGTAHFIEHRLFRQKWGDAFTAFSKQGASANAFTDGEKTVYYFTCQEHFMKNLHLLLSFVQNPFFTAEETEQEKSIIKSEITMYDDDPNWVVYYQMLEAMYHNHPVKYPIAGSGQSIEKIDNKVLKKAYDSLYTPERMSLICGGDIPLRKVLDATGMIQKGKPLVKPLFAREPEGVKESYRERSMGISRPLFQIGFKMPSPKAEEWKRRIAMGFLLEILAGESSAFYEKAYTEELLDEPLGSAYLSGEGYAFCAFSGNGEKSKKVGELLFASIEELRKNGVCQEDFDRIRKKQIGRFLRRSQSVSAMVMGQMEWSMAGKSGGEIFRYIKTIQKEAVETLLKEGFSAESMVLSVVR